MNKKKIIFSKKLYNYLCIIVFSVSIFLPVSYIYAALTCSVTTSTLCANTVLLRMSGSSNAHAELPSQSTGVYDNNVVCCSGIAGLSNSCAISNKETMVKLSGVTNAHVERNTESNYAHDACISSTYAGDEITVAYQTNDCDGYDTTLFSMSTTTTNGQVGDKGAYTNKICAKVNTVDGGDHGGGGGGGGGGEIITTAGTGVIFSGRAYPLSKISILKDGQLALSTIAGPDSNFTATLGNLSAGDYTFSVYGEDKNGLRSSPFTFQIFITSGVTTNIGGIFIAPTIAVDKSEVKRGDNIVIFGQSAPVAQIVISVNSAQEFFGNTSSDANGVYLHNFDTSVLELGEHSTKSKALKNGEISPFSGTVGFIVSTKNVLADTTNKLIKCDLNEDGRCNLIDFSIAAFWYKRPLSEAFKLKEIKHLNGDGIVDLVDFSIMAFYWTG